MTAATTSEPRLLDVQCLAPEGLHRMAYAEWGDAANPKVLVCVHGLSRQGRDFDTFARAMCGEYRVVCPDVAGRIQAMTVGSLDYSVSREAREKVEGEVAAQAIVRFRAKAADYAKAFGYATFTVRDANVNIDNGQPTPRPFRAKIAQASSMSEALPVEAGSGSVTANVNGSIQLK